jgi:hypothetical protein
MDGPTSERVIETLLDQIEELKASQTPAPMEAGAEIHGMTVSANAMGPILFALHGTAALCSRIKIPPTHHCLFLCSTWQQVRP